MNAMTMLLLLTPAQIITNGGFESPTVTGTQTVTPIGWTGTAAIYNAPALADIGGQDQFAGVIGNLSQSFATAPGTQYTLMFSFASDPAFGPASLQVSFLGFTSTINHSTSAADNLDWRHPAFNIAAPGDTGTLTFTPLSGRPLVDRLLAGGASVPEPSSLFLVAMLLPFARRILNYKRSAAAVTTQMP